MVLMTHDTEKNYREKIFEEEFLPLIDSLFNFAYHLTGNEEDANDLVQETYLKALRFMRNYDEGTNAKAWLFTIMKNGFINDYRKKTRRPGQVDIESIQTYNKEEDSQLSGYFDLREDMFEHLMGDEITTAINRLPDDYRTVILLCDIEDFKYDEIAKILDVPVGTVRSRLHRARNMLKVQLMNYAQELGYEDKRK
ncbi:MAG: sigma-70 family RNA polymerase sigma factor [Saprospiraceae bacterium]